jgi:hypothetical protein
MEFQEKYKIDIALMDTTGSTVEAISPYFDMRGYNSIDFVAVGLSVPTAALSTIAKQGMDMRLLCATDSSGGGASALSSATAFAGRAAANVVALTDKANEILIQFTTLSSGATFSIGGYQWSFDSTAALTSRVLNSTGATGAASVAAEAFATAFNSTANNPIATSWKASTISSALIRIEPVDKNAQSTYISATGSTLVNMNIGRTVGHLSIEAQFLPDGKRWVAIGVKTTVVATPISVTAFRTVRDGPANNLTISKSKTMSSSTSK